MNTADTLPTRPRYAPYANGKYSLSMGLMALDLRDWIEVGETYEADLKEKERLLGERYNDVFAALPGSEEAQREVLVLLLEHMERYHPELITFDAGEITVKATGARYSMADFADKALDLAGRLVQEDLCLMTPGEGGYELAAASLCFPARWKLADKIGRPMARIHDPVPEFNEKMGRPVDRFFDHLKADKPISRLNWSVVDDPTLFQSSGHGHVDRRHRITRENAGDTLWIRIERQTLRRLPQSGDILFTIRTYVDPLSVLSTRPDLAEGLLSSIEGVPEGMARYKSITPYREEMTGYLADIVRRAA